MAHAQALLERGDSTVALQEQLHDAVAAREAAEARAQALQEELSSATARLEEAVARGTPRGEGAKVVLRKSFVRIRELQSRLAEAHAAVAEATALREGLAGAQERLEELQARFADEVCMLLYMCPLRLGCMMCNFCEGLQLLYRASVKMHDVKMHGV